MLGMNTSAACVDNADLPLLNDIWCELRPEDLICHSCCKAIHSDALIRTFRVDALAEEGAGNAGSRSVSAVGKRITLFDRHFECLISSGHQYICVSHVWHHSVSSLKAEGDRCNGTSGHEGYVARLVYTTAVKIYEGVADSRSEPFELWYDYISVPQWQDSLKVKILLMIPQLYSQASFTVVHLDDVDRGCLERMRQEGNDKDDSQARLDGTVALCNAHWFRRVWTAMEYVRSNKVRVMMKDFQILDDGNDLFIGEIWRVWTAETANFGDIFGLEKAAAKERNVLPWQIGRLNDLRKLKGTDFGPAYALLALRVCTNPMDFFYALLGLVKHTSTTLPLPNEPWMARLQIIQACLQGQDYSPLLAGPELTGWKPNPLRETGFNDVRTWGLGLRIAPPKYEILLKGERAVFKAQRVGTILFVNEFPHRPAPFVAFALRARFVLLHSGPDVGRFVANLGTRFFGQDYETIMERMRAVGRLQAVQDTLQELYALATSWPRITVKQLAHDLGLSNTELLTVQTGRGPKLTSLVDYTDPLKRHSPIRNSLANGSTIHMTTRSRAIGTRCLVCNRMFLVRAALYKPDEDVHGATAFRIPGLQYEKTLADGIGLIVKGHEVMGRFMYGCPCCHGAPVEEIEVDIPNIAMPRPNTYAYGSDDPA